MGRNAHFDDGATPKYRNTDAVPSGSYPGIQHVPHAELPHEFVQHHSMLGPENDKHGQQWQHTERETIRPGQVIKTAQPYVGKDHVDGYAGRRKPRATTPIDFRDPHARPDDEDDGSPRLLRLHGELWHVDGLHRAAGARQLGRPFKARVYDADRANAAAPTVPHPLPSREGIVGHITDGHVQDNEFVTSDHYHPDHGAEYGEQPWTDHDLHVYHQELHRGGVADHRHA